jgi:protein-disulfide isomerase
VRPVSGITAFLRLAAIVLAAMVAPIESMAQQAAARADADVDLLSRAGDARAVGADSARVIVIEFLDFACPTCQLFHVQRGDSLKRALGTDVRLVYVTLLHPNFLRSYHAAEAANCASVAGGRAAYTGMADRLFRNAAEWSEAGDPAPVFARYARELGVDAAVFEKCRAQDQTAPLIVSDMGTAATFGVEGTPTFVMIPRGAQSPDEALRVTGNVSIAQLTQLISQARDKAK